MARRALITGLVLVVAMSACDDDDDEGPGPETFTAVMTGAAERPNPVTTTATGSAEFEVNNDNTVDFTLRVSNMVGVRMAHIHGPATTEQPAGVLVTLLVPIAAPGQNFPGTNSVLSSGTFPSAQFTLNNVSVDSVLTLMRNGLAYVNVHTVANGGGEIRGQVQEN
jgi:hypothetical protein